MQKSEKKRVDVCSCSGTHISQKEYKRLCFHFGSLWEGKEVD